MQDLYILPVLSPLSLILWPFLCKTLLLKNDLLVQVNYKHFLEHVCCLFAIFLVLILKYFIALTPI